MFIHYCHLLQDWQFGKSKISYQMKLMMVSKKFKRKETAVVSPTWACNDDNTIHNVTALIKVLYTGVSIQPVCTFPVNACLHEVMILACHCWWIVQEWFHGCP